MKKTLLSLALITASGVGVAQQPPHKPLNAGDQLSFQHKEQQYSVVVSDNSKPAEGFYTLEREAANGERVPAGYVQLMDSKKLTVLTLPQGKKLHIVEKDGKTTVKELLEATPDRPLQPSQQRPANLPPTPLNIIEPGVTSTAQAAEVDVPTLDVLWIMDARLPAFANSEGYDFELSFANRRNVSQQIYANSEVPYQFRTAGVYAFQFDGALSGFPAETSADILDNLTNDPRVRYLADLHNADMVHYLGATDSRVCGLATLASSLDDQNQLQNIFSGSAVAYSRIACDGTTVAHEIGHNLALRHDRQTIESDGGATTDYKINYGFITDDLSAYTTMAYGSTCMELGGECIAAEQFADPDKLFQGSALGKTEAEIDAANAVRTLSLVAPSMALMSDAADLQPIQAQFASATSATLSWPAQSGAEEYYLINGFDFCTFGVLRASDIDDATVTQATEATVGLSGGLGLCVAAKINLADGSSAYKAVGQARLNSITQGSDVNVVLPSSNLVDLFAEDDTATIELNVTDTATANSDLSLGVLFGANGDVNTQQQAIADAQQWFDFSVSGSGDTRTATITLKQSVPQILAAAAVDQEQRHFMHLPLSIINTQQSNFALSADLWLEPTPTVNPISAYFTHNYRLIAGSSESINWQLNGVPSDMTPVIEQTGDVRLENFNYTLNRINGGEDIAVTITGDVPDVTDPGEWAVTADFARDLHPPIEQSMPVSGSNTPPVIDSVGVIPEQPSVGTPFTLEFRFSDLDGDISVGSAILTRSLNGGEVKEYLNDTLTNTRSVYTIEDELSAGTYTFSYSISDLAGNTVTELVDVTVLEPNSAPVIDDVTANASDLVEGDSVTLTVTASDDRTAADNLEYLWTQSQGPDVNASGQSSSQLTLTNLAAGSYQFDVTVTDEQGAGVASSATFNVAEQSEPPTDDTTTPPSSDSGGSSGGSTGWVLMLLALLRVSVGMLRSGKGSSTASGS